MLSLPMHQEHPKKLKAPGQGWQRSKMPQGAATEDDAPTSQEVGTSIDQLQVNLKKLKRKVKRLNKKLALLERVVNCAVEHF
jgi:hypothetical protein